MKNLLILCISIFLVSTASADVFLRCNNLKEGVNTKINIHIYKSLLGFTKVKYRKNITGKKWKKYKVISSDADSVVVKSLLGSPRVEDLSQCKWKYRRQCVYHTSINTLLTNKLHTYWYIFPKENCCTKNNDGTVAYLEGSDALTGEGTYCRVLQKIN